LAPRTGPRPTGKQPLATTGWDDGAQHIRHFQQHQDAYQARRHTTAGNVTEQLAHCSANHHDQQYNYHCEKSPNPFTQNVFLQYIQLRLTILYSLYLRF